jgi:hypothetical protein
MSQGLPSPLMFLLFAAASFLCLRFIIEKLARIDKPIWAGPVLAAFGALSGAYFHRIGLHQYFIWHLVIFALVIFSWHAKSRIDDKKLEKLRGQPAADGSVAPAPSSDVLENYTMTRRLLSFGLVSYLAAFSAAYYYLFTSQ